MAKRTHMPLPVLAHAEVRSTESRAYPSHRPTSQLPGGGNLWLGRSGLNPPGDATPSSEGAHGTRIPRRLRCHGNALIRRVHSCR
jgi:hypothetical protein